MIIRCPNCSTTYKVSGSVFDAPKPTFRCTRCKHVFMVQVRLQLTDEEAPAAVEQETRPAGEAAGPGRPRDADVRAGTSDFGEAPEDEALEDTVPEEDVPEEHVPEDHLPEENAPEEDVPPLEAEAAEDDAELPLETIGTETGSVAEEPADVDVDEVDEGMARGDPDEAPSSYRGFEIDTLETDLPQPPVKSEQAGVTNDEVPADKRSPDFEVEDDFLLPPAREPQTASRRRRGDARGSIVPLVSLVSLAVFAFVLVTVIYRANPQPLDSLIRRIPWYGSTIFDSRHFKRTLVCESVVSGVRPVLNHNEVFVVSGKLANRNDRGVHKVRIEARLFDAKGKELGQQTTFVGNAISAKIIQDMTLREISLLQSLKPQNNYQISPNESANFTVVFPKPETAVESFSCRVVSAEIAA